MKMEGKRPRGRPKLRWYDIVRRDLKACGKSRRNGPLTERDGNVSARPATPSRETAAKGEKGEKYHVFILRNQFVRTSTEVKRDVSTITTP